MNHHSFGVTFSGQVDKAAGIIRGVSVLTEGIAKGHGAYVDGITLSQVVAEAKKYSGGLKVVAGHTKSSDSVFAASGMLQNFRVEGGKVKADLHLLDSEVNRDKLMEMADKIPDTFGLSIAFSGDDEVRGGKTYSRCSEIYNAALVDRPAANPDGLFSVGREVDAFLGSNSPMTPEEISKQVDAKVSSALVEFSARLKSVEDSLTKANTERELSAKTVTELSTKLDTATKELSAKIGDEKSRMELAAQTVAKEFAAHIGKGAIIPPNPLGDPTVPTKESDGFIATVQKNFSETKSKSKALELAVAADPKGYKAFRSTNKEIQWAA